MILPISRQNNQLDSEYFGNSQTDSCSLKIPVLGATLEMALEKAYANATSQPTSTDNWPFHIVLDLSIDWVGILQQRMISLGMASINGPKFVEEFLDAVWQAAKKKRAPSFDDFWSYNIGSDIPKGERLEDFLTEVSVKSVSYLRQMNSRNFIS